MDLLEFIITIMRYRAIKNLLINFYLNVNNVVKIYYTLLLEQKIMNQFVKYVDI